jgi:signal transduction histidine kinase
MKGIVAQLLDFTRARLGVLGNATEHAIPATPIRVDAHSEGSNVVFTIENEGEPIIPDVLATLFEPGSPQRSDHEPSRNEPKRR